MAQAPAGASMDGLAIVGDFIRDGNEDVARDVVRTLLDRRVCARCCLRWIGSSQQCTLSELHWWASGSKGDAADAGYAPDAYVCSVCLGLMQLDGDSGGVGVGASKGRGGGCSGPSTSAPTPHVAKTYRGIVHELSRALDEAGFMAVGDPFTYEVYLPLSVLMRELALAHWLRQRFASDAIDLTGHGLEEWSKSPFGIKEAMKRALPSAISSMLGGMLVFKDHLEGGEMNYAFHFLTPTERGYEDTAIGEALRQTQSGGGGRSGRGGNGRKHRGGGKQSQSPFALLRAALRMEASRFWTLGGVAKPGDDASWFVSQAGAMQVVFSRHPSYVCGRYVKLSRELSQTAWLTPHTTISCSRGMEKGKGPSEGKENGERMRQGEGVKEGEGQGVRDGEGEEERGPVTSVEEAIARGVQTLTAADAFKMVAAGREDMDVRMLGGGRPFVMEVANASHRMIDASRLAADVTADVAVDASCDECNECMRALGPHVQVRGPRLTTRKAMDALKEGAEEKSKKYVALVRLSRPIRPDDVAVIGAMADVRLEQKTPVRVLHRRAGLVRERTLYSLGLELLTSTPSSSSPAHGGGAGKEEGEGEREGSPSASTPSPIPSTHFGLLTMHAQAGTYIKEFVHGDLGRTQPSLGSILGCEADIVHLDVTDVCLEFDPQALEQVPERIGQKRGRGQGERGGGAKRRRVLSN